MNLFKGFLRRFHDYNSDLGQERNKAALAQLDDGDANKKHIEQRTLSKIEAARLTNIALRRMKNDREKGLAQIELYLDDWQFHNGPITTKEQLANAIADCVDRVRQKATAAQATRQMAEDAAFEDLTGLKDFPF
jgi:hypothetical protein